MTENLTLYTLPAIGIPSRKWFNIAQEELVNPEETYTVAVYKTEYADRISESKTVLGSDVYDVVDDFSSRYGILSIVIILLPYEAIDEGKCIVTRDLKISVISDTEDKLLDINSIVGLEALVRRLASLYDFNNKGDLSFEWAVLPKGDLIVTSI